MAIVSTTQGVRDEIASRLNETESDSNTDQYTNWVNLGMRDIENTFAQSPHLRTSTDRTLSVGTRLYATPSDFSKMNSVTIPGADQRLNYLTPEQFDRLYASAAGVGTPAYYTVRGWGNNGQIEYYPSPTSTVGVVHLEYQRAIVTVSAGSSTPDIPPKFLELLIMYGEMYGHRRRGRYEQADRVEKQYETLKTRMQADLANQTTQDPTTTVNK